MCRDSAPRSRVRGAFLLEALVATAVFAIGVLGAAAFHAESMRRIDGARHRTAAAHMTLALMAKMWTEDPATLEARYGSGGEGFAAFARLARQLPGGERDENAPTVRFDAGPSASSRTVTATVRWQPAGNVTAHRFAASAVIGSN